MNNKKNSLLFFIPYLLWLLVFVLAPLALLVYQSILGSHGFTLENYQTYLSNPVYIHMTINSIWYAFLITLITLIFSYPTAYLLSRLKHKQFWLLLVILPTWINLLLKTYAFIGLLSKDGTVNEVFNMMGIASQQLLFSDTSFLLVASYIQLPFMILPIFNSLVEIDNNLIKAAQDLGANSYETLLKVILPLSMPGIKAGIQAVFIPSLSLFMITRLIGGNKVITLGTAIEEHFLVTQNWSLGSTIGVVLVIAMVITMLLTGNKHKKKGK